MNGLSVATDNATDVGLAKLHPKDRCLPGRDFGKHHLIGKLDELADDEFEELFHAADCNQPAVFVTPTLRSAYRQR